MATIRHQLLIRADQDKIFEALTTQEGLSNWWTRTCTCKPEVGFENEFRFGEQFLNRMKILDLQKDKRVEWECVEGADEWIGTHVIFDIEEKPDGKIFLNFQHAGWKDATEFFSNCNFNWGRFLLSLKYLLEKGKGNPFPDVL